MAKTPSPTGTGSQTISQVFAQKKLWAWWTQNGGRGTNMFNGSTEKGIDYSNGVFGTPIGVPVGGKVISIVHNNNSIGDIVMMQDSSGATWLYQHITASVRVGTTLGVGSVIGTQNGLPVDQYSTGTHIEVRYLPPGLYNAVTNSWNLPWVNPFGIFSSLSNQTAGTVGTGGTGSGIPPGQGQTGDGSVLPSTGGPETIFATGAGTYITLLQQVHQTLISHPGLYGLCLAIDEAEEFPGYIDLTVNGAGTAPTSTAINIPTILPGVTIPTGLTVPVYDVVGIARSIGATVTDNMLPLAIRGDLVMFGLIIVIALMVKLLAPVIEQVAKVAEMAA